MRSPAATLQALRAVSRLLEKNVQPSDIAVLTSGRLEVRAWEHLADLSLPLGAYNILSLSELDLAYRLCLEMCWAGTGRPISSAGTATLFRQIFPKLPLYLYRPPNDPYRHLQPLREHFELLARLGLQRGGHSQQELQLHTAQERELEAAFDAWMRVAAAAPVQSGALVMMQALQLVNRHSRSSAGVSLLPAAGIEDIGWNSSSGAVFSFASELLRKRHVFVLDGQHFSPAGVRLIYGLLGRARVEAREGRMSRQAAGGEERRHEAAADERQLTVFLDAEQAASRSSYKPPLASATALWHAASQAANASVKDRASCGTPDMLETSSSTAISDNDTMPSDSSPFWQLVHVDSAAALSSSSIQAALGRLTSTGGAAPSPSEEKQRKRSKKMTAAPAAAASRGESPAIVLNRQLDVFGRLVESSSGGPVAAVAAAAPGVAARAAGHASGTASPAIVPPCSFLSCPGITHEQLLLTAEAVEGGQHSPCSSGGRGFLACLGLSPGQPPSPAIAGVVDTLTELQQQQQQQSVSGATAPSPPSSTTSPPPSLVIGVIGKSSRQAAELAMALSDHYDARAKELQQQLKEVDRQLQQVSSSSSSSSPPPPSSPPDDHHRALLTARDILLEELQLLPRVLHDQSWKLADIEEVRSLLSLLAFAAKESDVSRSAFHLLCSSFYGLSTDSASLLLDYARRFHHGVSNHKQEGEGRMGDSSAAASLPGTGSSSSATAAASAPIPSVHASSASLLAAIEDIVQEQALEGADGAHTALKAAARPLMPPPEEGGLSGPAAAHFTPHLPSTITALGLQQRLLYLRSRLSQKEKEALLRFARDVEVFQRALKRKGSAAAAVTAYLRKSQLLRKLLQPSSSSEQLAGEAITALLKLLQDVEAGAVTAGLRGGLNGMGNGTMLGTASGGSMDGMVATADGREDLFEGTSLLAAVEESTGVSVAAEELPSATLLLQEVQEAAVEEDGDMLSTSDALTSESRSALASLVDGRGKASSLREEGASSAAASLFPSALTSQSPLSSSPRGLAFVFDALREEVFERGATFRASSVSPSALLQPSVSEGQGRGIEGPPEAAAGAAVPAAVPTSDLFQQSCGDVLEAVAAEQVLAGLQAGDAAQADLRSFRSAANAVAPGVTITVLSLQQALQHHFDWLIVPGMTESSFPGSFYSHPFPLPRKEELLQLLPEEMRIAAG